MMISSIVSADKDKDTDNDKDKDNDNDNDTLANIPFPISDEAMMISSMNDKDKDKHKHKHNDTRHNIPFPILDEAIMISSMNGINGIYDGTMMPCHLTSNGIKGDKDNLNI